MLTWTNIAIVAGVIATIGAAIDKFMLRRQKIELHIRLIKVWDHVDNVRFASIAQVIATYAKFKYEKFCEKNSRIKLTVYFAAISWIMTSLIAISYQFIIDTTIFTPVMLPMLSTYLVNFTFDTITLIVTIKVIFVVADRNHCYGILAVLLDIVLATVFAVCTVFGTIYFEIFTQNFHEYFPFVSQGAEAVRIDVEIAYNKYFNDEKVPKILSDIFIEFDLVKLVYDIRHYTSNFLEHGKFFAPAEMYLYFEDNSTAIKSAELPHTTLNVFYALSVYVPTVIFMLVILMFFLAKMLLDLSKVIIGHVIEVLTETDPASEPHKFIPGTLLAILVGIISAIAKAVASLVEA